MSNEKDEATHSDKDSIQGLTEEDLGAFRLAKRFAKILMCVRALNPHHNRKLHLDNLASLIVFSYFNPILESLRSLQQASEFSKVQKALGIKRMSLGSMSESLNVFDSGLLAELYEELYQNSPVLGVDDKIKNLGQEIIAVDGTVLRALPRIAWALWNGEGRNGIKIHTHFNLAKGVPSKIKVDTGSSGEVDALKESLIACQLYLLDRGYASYSLMKDIIEVGSSFVLRLPANRLYEAQEVRELTDADKAAGVVSDTIATLGPKKNPLKQAVRIVEIEVPEQEQRGLAPETLRDARGNAPRKKRGIPYRLILVTDRMDLSAETIGLLYLNRWKVEIFFRTLKRTIGCRHLMSDSLEGMTIQIYCALIATIFLIEIGGIAPSKRLLELFNMYLSNWVTDEEFILALKKLSEKS